MKHSSGKEKPTLLELSIRERRLLHHSSIRLMIMKEKIESFMEIQNILQLQKRIHLIL